MGAIRLMLALTVVFGHFIGHPFFRAGAGVVAVQAFFMISGFYIAMVLDTSYRDARGVFWANRALRLYPIYLFVAFVALLLKLFSEPAFAAGFAALPDGAKLLLGASNLLLFGQDWVLFFGVQNGHLTPVPSFRMSDVLLYKFLLVPQAWSLGIELAFYAIAPFLLKCSSRTLAGVVIASIVLRVLLAQVGLDGDPWFYRFFPSELAIFVTGSLGYRAMKHWRLAERFNGAPVAAVIVGAYLLLYGLVPAAPGMKRLILLAFLAVALPFIYRGSNASRLDRYVGDLSYPLYISHWLTLEIVNKVVGIAGHDAPLVSSVGGTLLVVAVCVAASVLLSFAIDEPIQRLRGRVRAAARKTSTSGPSGHLSAEGRPG